MRRSRSISPHRDPDSAPIRVVSVQRSVFCPSRGLLPSVLPSKGRVHRARFASGRSCVLQSVDSKRVRRTRGVGRTGDGGVFTTARCAPEGLALTHLRPLFAVCGNRQPATCSFAKPTTPRWSTCFARSWRKVADAGPGPKPGTILLRPRTGCPCPRVSAGRPGLRGCPGGSRRNPRSPTAAGWSRPCRTRRTTPSSPPIGCT